MLSASSPAPWFPATAGAAIAATSTTASTVRKPFRMFPSSRNLNCLSSPPRKQPTDQHHQPSIARHHLLPSRLVCSVTDVYIYARRAPGVPFWKLRFFPVSLSIYRVPPGLSRDFAGGTPRFIRHSARYSTSRLILSLYAGPPSS